MNRISRALAVSITLVFVVFAGLEKVASAQQPERVRVFIGFSNLPGPAEEAIVEAAGGDVRYTYHLVPAIAATVPVTAIPGLQHNPLVSVLELDSEVQANDAELDNTWGVNRIDAGVVHDEGNKGTGVRVGIIDTGIDYNHPDLAANYVGGYDFVNNDNDPMDDNGHGTHTGGTVGAVDNGVGVVGVAPEVSLYALKVLGANGSGSYSDIIAALQWCVDNGIQVTNNSYGSSGNPGLTVQAAFDNSWAAGVFHAASAGNRGQCNPPLGSNTVGFPGQFASTVAVAALSSSDARACFSSTGPDVEISAPGVSIKSTVPGGGYASWSGTSMASPHVAGVAALLMAGSMTNEEARQRMRDTADDLGPAGWDEGYGWGIVDADEAADFGPVNNAPQVAIALPNDGDTYEPGTMVDFQGSASDFEDGDLTANISWTSNLDGALGTGAACTYMLSEGDHTITASVMDSGGRGGNDVAHVSVEAPAPPPPPPGEVAVTSIAYRSKGKRRKNLFVDVTLREGNGNPVSGATITIKVTQVSGGNSSKTLSGVTGANGQVSVKWRRAPAGCFESVVTSVSAPGMTWDGSTPPNSACQ